MKNKITLLLTMLALTSHAQLVTIDGLALHTNIAVTTGAQLTVIGLFTNDTYTASNHNYITQGDAWQPTGISKINSNFSYISNQLVLLMNLPNQINTNMAANIAVISNGFIIVSNAFVHYLATNQFAEYMATNFLPNYLATNPVGGTMNFDNANIVSDGLGDETNSGTLNTSLVKLNGHDAFFEWIGGDAEFYNGTGLSSLSLYDSGEVFLLNSICQLTLGASGGILLSDTSSGAQMQWDSSGNVLWQDLTFSIDEGAAYSDGSGNITCVSLTQTSDQTLKTNFTPISTSQVLAKIQGLSISNWTFKPRTFYTTNVVKTATATNAVVKTRTANDNHLHIGPMAQAWSARFGGGTNGINVTDAIGALLAGEQELASRCATNSPQMNATAIPIRSPNGTAWYLHVSNTGQVTADPAP